MQVIVAILTINLVYCNSLLTVIKDCDNVLKLTRRYKVADSLMNHVSVKSSFFFNFYKRSRD